MNKIVKTILIMLAILIVVGAATAAVMGAKKKENEKAREESSQKAEEDAETAFAVNITRAVDGEINNYIEINGDVQATTTIDILPETSGKLSRMLVNVGERVRENQVIAYVDPSRPGMDFADSPIKAPIAGTITSIPAKVGATVSPAMPVARVGKMTDLEITTQVSERFVSRMLPGLRALLRFPAYPDERFMAIVTEISPVIDPQTRSMEVKLKLTTNDPRIRAGMFAEVKIITESKQGIVKIPSRCLIKRYGGYYVFVVQEQSGDDAHARVEMRKVTPGIEIDNKVEITEGLAPDEPVVIRGQTLLENQTYVRVIEEIQPLTENDIVE